jgi:hypothetical protein
MAICVFLAVLTLVSSASAVELWDWHLRGANEGLASGALPPPGMYFINDFYWTGNWKLYDNGGHVATFAGTNSTFAKLSAYVDVPILLWNPGICPILGATYAAAVAQPFDGTTLRVDPSNQVIGTVDGTQWGVYQTILIPFILSWEIPCNFHVSASFAAGLNDGTTSPGDSLASVNKIYSDYPGFGQSGDRLTSKNGRNVYAWSASNNYTFTPALGISWLYAGWNLSAEFQYTFWTKDDDCNIQNGDQFAADYTLTYTCGKWTFGLGAQQENQVYNDKGNVLFPDGALHYMTVHDTCAVNYTAGPIVGYNFGPCSLLFTYNFEILTTHDVGGDWAMLRLIVPLGDPCTWYR